MNARRYVVCGVVSVALHSLALYAQQPPTPEFSMSDAQTGHRVAIQLVAAATPKAQPEEKVEEKEPPAPEIQEKPPLVEPTLKPLPPEKKPIVEAKVEKPLPKPIPKPKKVEPPQPKKEKPKQVDVPKPKAVEKKKTEVEPVEKKPVVKPEEDADNKPQDKVADAQMNQAKDSAPVLVERPAFKVRPSQPKYPRIAKRRGMEGNVLIEVWLDKEGNQTDQNILKSSGFKELDTAALDAVKKWRFNGYKQDGVALAHRVRIPVRFNLD
ncbi:energy transducer TonB [Enterovibrio calviensis]|uniref:energy transducer TonB n=1 Tax=Enterovibrio calviensis TaxID=91359 RepID=UPI0004830423|nr:energy transducer TonB [Enterovibrio calviensis]